MKRKSLFALPVSLLFVALSLVFFSGYSVANAMNPTRRAPARVETDDKIDAGVGYELACVWRCD